MANYYIWSGATGTNNGSSWANAYIALQTAMASKAVGDVFFVAHDHAEVAAGGITLQGPGTVNNASKVICVDRNGSVPPVSADRRNTASVTSSGNNNLAFHGFAHFDGIIFNAGAGSTGSVRMPLNFVINGFQRFDNCSLRLVGTTGASYFEPVTGGFGGGSMVELVNTTLSFGNASCYIYGTGTLKWRDTPNAIFGPVKPSLLFSPTGSYSCDVECINVDFSALGAGCTIVGSFGNAQADRFKFVDCKFDPAVIRSAEPAGMGSTSTDIVRSNNNYSLYYHRFGALLTDETSVVRQGGNTDGATPASWRIATTSNINASMPFTSPPIAIWNDRVGVPVTATVEGILQGPAVPNDDECWLRVEYLGAGPLGLSVSDHKADLLAAATPQTISAAVWGGGLTSIPISLDGVPSSATLSNGNLTATHNASVSNSGARSTASKSTGKFYFEGKFGVTTGTSDCVAIMLLGSTYTNLVTSGSNCMAVYRSNGAIWSNGGNSGYSFGALNQNDIMCVAYDLDARKGWINRNGGLWNNNASASPLTGVNGAIIGAGSFAPAVGFGGASAGSPGDSITVNFGATAFAYTPPAGYAVISPSAPRPFKLDVTFTPQQRGWVYAYVKCAIPSTNFYIDPLVTLS